MGNIHNLEEQLRVSLKVLRSRATQLEMEIGDGEDGAYGTFLIDASNKILDCALDLSRMAAMIERAIAETSSRFLVER
jgi:hypothetical protein